MLSTMAAVGAGSSAFDSNRLDRLENAEVGDPLPPGWQVRPMRGVDVPDSEVVEETRHSDLGRALRFEAQGQGAFFWLELDEPITPATQSLRWHWKVEAPVDGADLGEPERDDAPARFFVVFGEGGTFSMPEILFYSWDGTARDVGAHWIYPDDDNFRVMVARNARSPVGEWLQETRDLHEDYRRAFGGDPEPVTAVGFVIDTDDTGARAVSLLGPVETAVRTSRARDAPRGDAGAR